ncbi:trypsin-2-like [Babylonia areolata]|uniref:trypsin-2-like n=1 Tax=Babylonia areolata TaxID=304850 RepID=UPI003FD569B5
MYAAVVFALALAHYAAAGESPEERVVNGYVVDPPNSFPWQLSLKSNGYHICGAVVYNSRYVITAAHCVEGGSASRYQVACGAHDIYAHEPDRQTVQVAAITIHPKYRYTTRYAFPNDIAVLRLSTPLSLNAKCQAAKLDTGTDFSNNPAVITGWGRLAGGGATPRKLKRGDVEALSRSKCRSYSYYIHDDYHVCLKDLGDRYYGGCNGDSGGPAQVNNVVIGLASFVFGSCHTSYPTVYTRVSTYTDWIRDTVATMG